MPPLPFSARTVAAVSVFPCIFVASPQGARRLTCNVATVSSLALAYAQLTAVYPQIIHQDTENNRADLYAAIATAIATLCALNTTLQGMTASGDAAFVLADMQIVVANALAALQTITPWNRCPNNNPPPSF
jgi:hypothetical protein